MGANGATGGSRVRGLAAAAVLLLLVAGFPAALWAVAGSPIPDGLPTWDQFTTALGSPVADGLILGVLKYVAWAGWLIFTASVVVEVAARIRGVKAPNLGPQQALAAALVTAAAIGLAGPAAAAPPTQGAPATVEQTHTPTTATPAESPEALVQQPRAQAPLPYDTPVPIAPIGTDPLSPPAGFHARVIQHGELLWDIAEEELGDGLRYTEIFAASTAIVQPDGSRIERPHQVRPGWTVWIPDQAPTGTDTHIVARGESLWDIAAATLGDPQRYMDLYRANAGVVQADGLTLTDPRVIEPGWILRIPTTPDQPTSASASPDPTVVPDPGITPDPGGTRDPGGAPVAGAAAPSLSTRTPLDPGAPAVPARPAPAPAAAPPAPPAAAPASPLATATPLRPGAPATPSEAQPAAAPLPSLNPVTPLSPQAAVFDVTTTGLTVAFTAPPTPGADYHWLFGDGTTGSGPTPTHSYRAPGTYLVTVTIATPDGDLSTISRQVATA